MAGIAEIDEIVQEEVVDQEEKAWAERRVSIKVQAVERKPSERGQKRLGKIGEIFMEVARREFNKDHWYPVL